MPEPMYRRIAEDLRQKIEVGELEHGSQLPTELELREQYDASRNTVRDAIKWLITRGLVETRPGQGTFVVEKIYPFITTLTGELTWGGVGDLYRTEVKALQRTPYATDPRVELQQASGVMATDLELEDGTSVVSRHQQRYIDERSWSLQTSFYPMTFVDRGAIRLIQAVDINQGTVQYLKETLGIEQVGYRDKLAVRAPDSIEAAFFELPSDGRVQVVEIRRIAYDVSGKPIRLTVTVYPADRNQFVVNVGNVPEETINQISGTANTESLKKEAMPEAVSSG